MVKNDTLGKLFGSPQRVKVMRLFLFNPEDTYDVDDASKRTKSSKIVIRKELSSLLSAGLLKKKIFFKKREGKATKGKKKVPGFALDKDFHYLSALQNLLIKIPPFTSSDLEKRFKGSGSVKLLIISGVFLQEWESSADILIVGDKLNHTSIDRAVSSLEAEIGRELTYAVFDTAEFEYRTNVHDKLVRDILDFPHEKIVNRLGI